MAPHIPQHAEPPRETRLKTAACSARDVGEFRHDDGHAPDHRDDDVERLGNERGLAEGNLNRLRTNVSVASPRSTIAPAAKRTADAPAARGTSAGAP